MDITKELSKKGADAKRIAAYVIKNPEHIPDLVEGITAPKGTLRYGYDKVLRLISQERPELVYPYFDVYAKLLDSDNSFIKWGAILTIGNLACVDSEKKFEKIFKKYYRPVTGPVMITAANTIGASVKIAKAKPALTKKITAEILKVEKAEFINKGEVSPECRNVALGQAIESLGEFFEQIEDKACVVKFVKRQLKNTRKSTVKKAEKFLKTYCV